MSMPDNLQMAGRLSADHSWMWDYTLVRVGNQGDHLILHYINSRAPRTRGGHISNLCQFLPLSLTSKTVVYAYQYACYLPPNFVLCCTIGKWGVM